MLSRRAALAAAAVITLTPALAAGSGVGTVAMSASPPSLSSTIVSHGLRITLTVPGRSYPLNGLVLTTISVRNVGSGVARILDSACTGQGIQTQVLDKHGKPYPWPLPVTALPCPLPSPIKLAPGKSISRSSVAYLRSGVLRADLTLETAGDDVVDATGKTLTLPTFSGQAEHATFASKPGTAGQFTSSLWPVPKNPGMLYVASIQVCGGTHGGERTVSLPGSWEHLSGSVISTSIFRQSCTHEEWRFVAGWIGYPVARLQVSIDGS